MIAITGDTHNMIDDIKMKAELFTQQAKRKLTKEDYLCVVGDFGFLYRFNKNYKEILLMFENFPFTTLFVDGNHEDFDVINSLKEVDMFGSKVGKFTNSIFHLKRGEIYTIDDKKFFVMGGANSIDKEMRTLGFDYFFEEIPSYADELNAFQNIDKHFNYVDYVLTHTAPTFVVNTVLHSLNLTHKYNDQTEILLRHLELELEYKKWFFGHFHTDGLFLDKFRCIQNEVEIIN